MRILFNLGTLKKGGGLTVGISYLRCLLSLDSNFYNNYFVVPVNSILEEELLNKGVKNYSTVPNNPFKRFLFERIHGRKIIETYKIDVIYSIFGIGFYPKSCLQISGSADSNIFFPEIDFWDGYYGLEKWKKKFIDFYRIMALKRANAVIFENESLLNRSRELFSLRHVLYSKPSINNDFAHELVNIPNLKGFLVGLFLCGWQKNKNYILIPEILKEFKRRNIDFHILFTAPVSDRGAYNEFLLKVKECQVSDRVTFLGPVKKSQLKCLYESVDYVFLLSKLESFSNNIIESWFFNKPLVISDEEWSRSICKNAAVFVKRNSSANICDKICELEQRREFKENLLSNARRLLSTYPSMDEKINFELSYIQSLYEEYG